MSIGFTDLLRIAECDFQTCEAMEKFRAVRLN